MLLMLFVFTRMLLVFIILVYMALACGQYNARSDWLRARSEQSLCSRNAHGPITDYAIRKSSAR